MKFFNSIIILLLAISLTACVSNVRSTNTVSVKSEKKLNSVLIFTTTPDLALDVGGLFPPKYYRILIDKIKSDMLQSGVTIDELQYKADENSLDPREDMKKALESKNAGNVLYIDATNISKMKSSGMFFIGFQIKVSLIDNKLHKKLYDGEFTSNQSIDLATASRMRGLGDKVFGELEAPLGISGQEL